MRQVYVMATRPVNLPLLMITRLVTSLFIVLVIDVALLGDHTEPTLPKTQMNL